MLDLMVEKKNEGRTVLMSTHILATAERYCDRFIILDKGKVVAFGDLEELRKQTGLVVTHLMTSIYMSHKVVKKMDNSATSLFKSRLNTIQKEKRYYNKFIFNGHFSVFLLILLGAFILGYGQWLQHIPKHIDYTLCASIILAVTSIFPIRTFLKDADRIFYCLLKNI